MFASTLLKTFGCSTCGLQDEFLFPILLLLNSVTLLTFLGWAGKDQVWVPTWFVNSSHFKWGKRIDFNYIYVQEHYYQRMKLGARHSDRLGSWSPYSFVRSSLPSLLQVRGTISSPDFSHHRWIQKEYPHLCHYRLILSLLKLHLNGIRH